MNKKSINKGIPTTPKNKNKKKCTQTMIKRAIPVIP